jgi:uncharacterized phage-like protein YoqJ
MEKFKCAFTGHRVLREDFDREILVDCIRHVIECGADTFYCGMAIGFDLIAASALLELKKEYPFVKLVACIPCQGQEKYYVDEYKQMYYDVLSNCDEVNVLAKNYYKGCMHVRDNYMVDNCDAVIAYMYEESGGTHYTVKYAEKKNKLIYILQ